MPRIFKEGFGHKTKPETDDRIFSGTDEISVGKPESDFGENNNAAVIKIDDIAFIRLNPEKLDRLILALENLKSE